MTGNNSIPLDEATLQMFANKAASHAVSVLYVIVTLISLPANGFSLWLLAFRTSPKTSSIIFMINLTITDLAVGVVLPFQIVYQSTGYNWNFGSGMCSLMTVMFYSNMYCSILTMTAISVNRYLGIVRPMQFKESKCRRGWAVVGCILMWATVLLALFPLQKTDLTYKVAALNITTCFDVLKKSMLPNIAHWALFLFTLFVILFLIPFVITVFCYISIIKKLIIKGTTVQKRRSLHMAFLVLLVFVLCFAPNNIILLAHIVRRLFFDGSFYMQYKLTLSLSCINSCLDPFIYYLASKDFRRNLRGALGMQTSSSGDHPMSDQHRESFFSARSLSQGHAEE
ncbi:P2Y purinoceptor 8-like [Scleropages formosus]|uniref:P2Y receptor family member 8 n=1 Tax=Scleropages formosus TaxID=113540 RepID=A0A0P7TWI2_SCLFO|nr:P2Y purinoceptor 8 [Scleropages formosus]KPP58140.1 P2Y purinoceptor 8-like [Scleropages formosus]